MSLAHSSEAFAALFIFLTGLCFGSFLNVVVYRLPRRRSLIKPPSSCPSCSRRLGFIELIPLIGYILLRARCRHCGVRISPRYPLIELACAVLFLTTYLRFAPGIEFIFNLTLLYLLLGITFIDLEHRIVPNGLVAAGLAIGALLYLPQAAGYLIPLPEVMTASRPLTDAFFGLLLGGGLMLLIFLVSRGGMGAGDLKLMAMIGFYVGLRGTAVVMLLGFLFGALVGVFFMVRRKMTRKDALPFAPYLALGTLVEVFFGEEIWHWYINLLR